MLNHQDLRIARIKAAMWESRNTDKLISKAIRSYMDPSYTNMPKEDITFNLGVNGKREVTVKNVPHIFHNNEMYRNLLLTSTLEEVLEEEFADTSELEFADLLK